MIAQKYSTFKMKIENVNRLVWLECLSYISVWIFVSILYQLVI